MNRRELLQLGAATVAIGSVARSALAQNAPVAGKKSTLDAYSRTLHWCRTPAEVARACHEIGNTTIDLTVRPYPGHVLPEKVKTDLPVFVNGLKRDGITVTKIAMDVADVETPYAEAMMDTAASLGIHHTWWRGLTFDWTQPYQKMIDGLKPRVATFEKMLAKYNFKACYHPGGGFTELLDLVRGFDPRYISLQYDTGNFGQFNQGMLANQIRIAGPYVGSFVFKDNYIERLSTQQQAGAAAAGGAGRGGAAAPAEAAGAPAGRGGQAGGGQPGGGQAGGGQAAGGRGGAAGGAAPGAGRGGGNASPNGFSQRQVPVGTGILNLPVVCQALKDINFTGPIHIQPEWPELGGPGSGLDRISIPREEVIRLLKRDFDTVATPLKAAGVI